MKRSKIGILTILLILISTAGSSTSVLGQEPTGIERSKILATRGRVVWKALQAMEVPSGDKGQTVSVRSSDFGEPAAPGMRLHVSVETKDSEKCWLVHLMKNGKVASSHSFDTEGSNSFWSSEIRGNEIAVRAINRCEQITLRVIVDGITVLLPTPVVPTSIFGTNELRPIREQSATIKEAGKSVARLRFNGDDGGYYVCTGFLISQDLFMTNDHCPRSEKEWRSAMVDFDFDTDDSEPRVTRFKEKIASDSPLDFAVYRLAEKQNRTPFRLDPVIPQPGAFLMIIQHPGGEPKQVSLVSCRVSGGPVAGVTPALSDLAHECDTLGGSSGSGVFELSTMKVVGLHHLGFNPGLGLQKNRAVLMKEIVQFIKAKQTALAKELSL